MDRQPSTTVREAFRAEAARLCAVLVNLDEDDFDRPTNCPPWTVRDMVAHIRIAVERLTEALAEPAPAEVDTDAAGYYAAAKFVAAKDRARVDQAHKEAVALGTGSALVTYLDRTWRAADQAVAAAPALRPVRTPHDDRMTLQDFLLTRVVELGVHGLDLAAALMRDPWLTEPAAALIADLLAGPTGPDALAALGWDRLTFIAKATGRAPLTAAERAEAERRGLRWLAFS